MTARGRASPVDAGREGTHLKWRSRHIWAALLAGIVSGGGSAMAGEPPLDGTRPLTDPLVCLARTIYFEARGRSDAEMAAVGHVVMNRARDSQFPGDVCAVIREGGETPPCQFSWWCDGRSDVAVDRVEYAHAVRVARGVLNGTVPDPTHGANMFHNLSVIPGWAASAEPRGRIGNQRFYYLKER